ncbi:MAG TPA: hypothetical protein DIW30_03425 [Bacteroidales bacterium]|nr:hypothetical protein [Bacteroidales bacterium]
MKRQPFIILLLAALLPIGCSKKASTENSFKTESLNGEWQIVSIHQETLQTAADEEIPSISFNTEDKSFSCYVGCNRMGGTLSTDNDSLRLGNIFSTRMYCPDKMGTEQKLGIALEQVRLAQTSDDGNLLLQDAEGRTLVTLLRTGD